MKEPWKKTCNGKVIITLNDEKTEPTEVELPVDLNWSSKTPGQCNISVSKTIVLLSFIFLLGLSTYALWKVQELENVIEDDRDIMSILKQTLTSEKTNDPILMILEDKDDDNSNFPKFLKPEPLIGLSKKDKDDLRSSESQYQNHKLNSINSAELKESKDTDLPVKNSKKFESQEQNLKNQKTRNTKSSEEIDDARDTPNPNDSEEWIKPLVETFDIFGNHPVEDQFIHNVLMKLLMPENNVEVVEFNKMNGAPVQDENKNLLKKSKPKPFPLPIESLIMKSLLPPASSFKIFHFNEKPENFAEDKRARINEQMEIKQMMPPMLPNFKMFPFNDQKSDSSMEEDMPKITIQSIKLKLLPLPPQEEYIKKDPSAGNIEVIRLNDPQASNSEEDPQKMPPMHNDHFNPLPLPDFIMKTLLPIKNFDIIPLNERSDQNSGENDMSKQIQPMERMNPPLPFPLQDIIMKTFLPPPNTFDIPMHMLQDTQEPSNPDVEVSKVPVHTVKITSMPIPERMPPQELKTSMLPGSNYEVINIPVSDHQEMPQKEMMPKSVQGRSTKLNPVNVPWEIVPPHERVQN